jgi:hypothetical protein
LLTVDAWIIRWVFQPIVDALVDWRTHFGLAKLCMYGACGCMAVASIVLLFTTFWWSSALYLIGAWGWLANARAYDALEELEAKGYIAPPVLWLAYLRLFHIMMLIILIIVTVEFVAIHAAIQHILWMAITTVGWSFAVCAHYFAACLPGKPRRNFIFRWQPA